MPKDEASEECLIFDIEGDDKRGGGAREGIVAKAERTPCTALCARYIRGLLR
jgi:hypothetical protein